MQALSKLRSMVTESIRTAECEAVERLKAENDPVEVEHAKD